MPRPFATPTPAPTQYAPQTLNYSRNRWKLVLLGIPVLLLFIGIGVAVSQLRVVRDFFGQASGEPANIVIDTQAVLGPVERPWRYLAQGGEGHDWRMGPIIPQVKALNPEYIRLDHIYDFYEIVGGTPGNLTFDFTKFDGILDDIAATGAKPYIALSYMPPVISKSDIIDEPQRWEDWQLVIQKTIEHVSGTRKTADVYYEVWNEPDLFGGWHYGKGKNYMTLYLYAARGAANARGVQPFKFGGPGITALYKNWFDALARRATESNLRMDFFSWHRYAMTLEQYKTDMTDASNWLGAYPQLGPTTELHITEWGHDSRNHAGYDGNLGAAHTVAGSIEMIGVVQKAFAFEIQDGKDPEGKEYWGRWGMFTHQDFGSKPKPRYHALRMLDRISDQRLQLLGKGTWVKALAARDPEGNVEVVLANYDSKGRNTEQVPVTFENIVPGSYTVSMEFVGGRKNSVNIATTAAVLQANIPMTPNSVAFVELVKNP
jgi:beta-xylosidase